MRKKERKREVIAIDMEKDPGQPPTAADPAPSDTEDGTESPSPAPGLLIFGAGSEALCTDDGCFVSFEKG